MLDEPENNNHICRLCLEKSANQSIFNENSIAEKITSCCTLQIYENDGLPDHICNECLNTLNKIADFKNRCHENDRILRESVFNIKTEEYEIPDIKEEYFTEVDEDNIDNFTSVEFNNIEPDKNIYSISKRKTKKPLKKVISTKEVQNIIDENENDEKPLNLLKRHRKKQLNTDDHSSLCSFCGKVFFKAASLKAHLKLHTMEKTYTCSKCSKAFRDSRKLKDHERTHLNIKDFPCEVCGKLFGTRHSAKKHISAVHHKSQVVSCNLCNKKLSSSRSLKGHMKTHTGEREFECAICEQAFTFKSSLIVHLRCHTGEKPYSCKYCGARFAALKTITEHERLHTGETPYLCPVCSKGFSQKSNMKSHFRNNHKGVEFS